MPRTKEPTRMEEIEFAAELGERFPDFTDGQVIDAMDEFLGVENGYTNPNSVMAHIWLQAYDGGVKAAVRYAKSTFGFDPTKS